MFNSPKANINNLNYILSIKINLFVMFVTKFIFVI